MENFKYYKYTELFIENIIQIFYNPANTKRFLTHMEKLKDILFKYYKWLKQNPISPQYCNSRDTVLFKKKPTPSTNMPMNELQQCKKFLR